MTGQGVGTDKGFEERKRKYEEKWALDEDLRFKATARRNKLFGRWAAGELGLSGEKAEEYAKAVVASGLHTPGEDAAFRKVHDDLQVAGITRTQAELQEKILEMTELARRQILGDRA